MANTVSILKDAWRLDSKIIMDNIPSTITTYVEPFATDFTTGFKLLNNMDKHNIKTFVLNTNNTNTYTFWRCLAENPNQLVESINRLYRIIAHSSNKDIAFRKLADTQSRYEQAAYEYLYRYNKNLSAYGHNYRIKQLDVDTDKFIEISKQLQKVSISNLDYESVVALYENKATIFIFNMVNLKVGSNLVSESKHIDFDIEELRYLLCNTANNWIVRCLDDDVTKLLYSQSSCIKFTTNCIHGQAYNERYYAQLIEG